MKSPARWCRATERKGQRYVHIRLGNNKMSVNQANPRHVLEFTRGQELRGCGDLWQGSKGGTSFHQGVSGSPGGEAMCGVHRRYAKHAKRIWFRCISLVCREANQPTIRATPPVDPIQTDPSWPWMAWLAWQFAILNTLKRSAEGWEIGGSSGHRRGVKRGYQALRGAAAVRVGDGKAERGGRTAVLRLHWMPKAATWLRGTGVNGVGTWPFRLSKNFPEFRRALNHGTILKWEFCCLFLVWQYLRW